MDIDIRIGRAIRALGIAVIALGVAYDTFDKRCAQQVAQILRAAEPVQFGGLDERVGRSAPTPGATS